MARLASKSLVAAAAVLLALSSRERPGPAQAMARAGALGATAIASAKASVPAPRHADRLTVKDERPLLAASDSPSLAEAEPRQRKKASKADKKAERALDPARAIATYPGFAMLSGGRSKVWVAINQKVEVQALGKGRIRSFLLVGTQVGPRNNTNPLITTHFPTPLARAQLRRHAKGAELVLWLRDDVDVSVRSVSGPKGTITVEVELPPRPSAGKERPAS
jgi:hypothetical protein